MFCIVHRIRGTTPCRQLSRRVHRYAIPLRFIHLRRPVWKVFNTIKNQTKEGFFILFNRQTLQYMQTMYYYSASSDIKAINQGEYMSNFSAEQIEQRRETLGGSDAAAAIGVSPYQTPLEVYMVKTGMTKPADLSANQAVYWGSRLEDIIAEEYARRTNADCTFPKETFIHKKFPFMSAHIDGEVRSERKVIECKTANLFVEKDWGDENTDEIPLHYIVQVQHCIAVLDYQSADVAVLIGGQDYRIYHIKRDNVFIAKMIHAENVFWTRVQEQRPPPPTTLGDIKLLYSIDDGSAVQANDRIYDVVQQIKAGKLSAKLLDTEQKDLELELKLFMGKSKTLLHEKSIVPIVTWNTQDNNRFQVTPFRRDNADLAEQYTVNKPVRVLRIKK